MRLFELHRTRDVSGISGTGVVAQGVEFDDGKVALRWLRPTGNHTTSIFDNIAAVEVIHGHKGAGSIVFKSATPISTQPEAPIPLQDARKEPVGLQMTNQGFLALLSQLEGLAYGALRPRNLEGEVVLIQDGLGTEVSLSIVKPVPKKHLISL